jgi:predicted metalloprotease with PDZ domain
MTNPSHPGVARRRAPSRALAVLLFAILTACSTTTRGVRPVPAPDGAPLVSAPVRDLRYAVTFDAASARQRLLRVSTTVGVEGTEPVLLSLPAWTPGAYEISNFARNVFRFTPTQNQRPLRWDKVDYDTWRVWPVAAGDVEVRFDYLADSLDNAMAWARRDFAFFNGTNVFLYPEGRCCDFPAAVTVRTEAGWNVATGMTPAGAPRTYREANYHDLVDMPFFVGRFDLDSAEIAGRVTRLATYPERAIVGARRQRLWEHHRQMIPPQIAVFQDTPYQTYTTMIVVDEGIGGGSALEHQNSHVGIYHPALLDQVVLPSITAHEIFHLWNVKRLRPAQLWPYRYDVAQPTTLLWMSEGFTDYYADLALVRGGIVDSAGFLELTQAKMQNTAAALPVALEDASLSTWIHPRDGTGYIYYDKGSLVGFLLDIRIRDASDNRASLDDVMRELYRAAYLQGRGFTDDEFWAAASRAAGGRSFAEERARYVDGRDPLPWDTVLPLAGLRLGVDTVRVPLLGVQNRADSAGVRVEEVDPAGAAAKAGVRAGDYLVSVGDVPVTGLDYGAQFRARYATRDGEPLRIVVRRDGRLVTLTGRVTVVTQVRGALSADPSASDKARRVREGIWRGR